MTIARCDHCTGLWLGEAQLDQLARYRAGNPAINQLAATMAADHRRDRRWEVAKSLLHSKWLSGGVAAAYLIAGVAVTGELRSVVSTLGFLILPLACIWLSDGMGRVIGVSGALVAPRITRETPAAMVAVGGAAAPCSLGDSPSLAPTSGGMIPSRVSQNKILRD